MINPKSMRNTILVVLFSALATSCASVGPAIPLGSGPEVWVKESRGNAQSTVVIPDAIYYCKGGEHPTCTQARKVELGK